MRIRMGCIGAVADSGRDGWDGRPQIRCLEIEFRLGGCGMGESPHWLSPNERPAIASLPVITGRGCRFLSTRCSLSGPLIEFESPSFLPEGHPGQPVRLAATYILATGSGERGRIAFKFEKHSF